MSTTTVERYAGVDVSKARLDVAVRPTGERYSVANDPEGIDTLLGGLEEAGPPEVVVLEATGGFERPAAMPLRFGHPRRCGQLPPGKGLRQGDRYPLSTTARGLKARGIPKLSSRWRVGGSASCGRCCATRQPSRPPLRLDIFIEIRLDISVNRDEKKG